MLIFFILRRIHEAHQFFPHKSQSSVLSPRRGGSWIAWFVVKYMANACVHNGGKLFSGSPAVRLMQGHGDYCLGGSDTQPHCYHLDTTGQHNISCQPFRPKALLLDCFSCVQLLRRPGSKTFTKHLCCYDNTLNGSYPFLVMPGSLAWLFVDIVEDTLSALSGRYCWFIITDTLITRLRKHTSLMFRGNMKVIN